MRRARYNVAASLDGFITDAANGFDWIPHDTSVDFGALFERVDTVIMGRRTYDVLRTAGGEMPWKAGTRVYVVSRTMQQPDATDTIVVTDPVATMTALRNEQGSGEIWLFGGGELFATLLAAGQVDAVEVTVVPILLGAGTPLVAPGIPRTTLTLTSSHRYPSGMMALHYDVGRV